MSKFEVVMPTKFGGFRFSINDVEGDPEMCFEDTAEIIESSKVELDWMMFKIDDQEISFARLRELASAEREGILAVLPKVGDTLFYAPYPKSATGIDGETLFLRNTGDGTGVVRRVVVAVMFDNWAAQVPLKRTWKTKNEAEAAAALAQTEKGEANEHK